MKSLISDKNEILEMKYEKEEVYYDLLLNWLEQKGYYTGGESLYDGKLNWYKNIGPERKCRLDVIGVKNIGSQNWTQVDDIELIGIEVKSGTLTYKDLSQAAGYKIFVHKAYLATNIEITPVDEHWARILGIGLISLPKKPRSSKKPIIIFEASYQKPNLNEMLRLLRRMSISRCTICRSYFMRWEIVDDALFHTYVSIPRIKQINLIAQRDEEEDWQNLIDNPEKGSKENRINRYICRSCANFLEIEIKGQPEPEIDE